MPRAAIACLALAAASPAVAADFAVTVRDQQGRALQDAVVIVRPVSGGRSAAPIRFAWPMVVSQRNIAFDPYLLIVPVGSEVSFSNRDKVRHHVYSFSAAKRFEIKLFGRQEAPQVVFDKPGPVALGCNIHDQMIAYIYVTDSPFTAKTAAGGEAVVKGLPAGAATLTIWRPDLQSRKPIAQTVNVTDGGRTTIAVALRPPVRGTKAH